MKKLLTAIIITTSLIIYSCDSTEPTEEIYPPGRRDYVWTIDTLHLPFNNFNSITGTSPTDLWICGPGDADKTFFYYDGNKWFTDSHFRLLEPKAISSLDANDIWSCGRSGRVWHYDGAWNEIYKHTINETDKITFESIYTVNSSNIIAAGQYFVENEYFGIIITFNGYIWQQIDIPKIRTAFGAIQSTDNGKIYLWGVTNNLVGESGYQFYEFNGNAIKEIYSGTWTSNEDYGGLLQLGTKTYFIIGHDFFKYDGNYFNKIGRLSSDPKFMNAGIGRNEKDIFLGMRDGIAHYNGENTVYLYQTKDNVYVRKGIVFENDVFFLGRDINGNNFIFHGMLK